MVEEANHNKNKNIKSTQPEEPPPKPQLRLEEDDMLNNMEAAADCNVKDKNAEEKRKKALMKKDSIPTSPPTTTTTASVADVATKEGTSTRAGGGDDGGLSQPPVSSSLLVQLLQNEQVVFSTTNSDSEYEYFDCTEPPQEEEDDEYDEITLDSSFGSKADQKTRRQQQVVAQQQQVLLQEKKKNNNNNKGDTSNNQSKSASQGQVRSSGGMVDLEGQRRSDKSQRTTEPPSLVVEDMPVVDMTFVKDLEEQRVYQATTHPHPARKIITIEKEMDMMMMMKKKPCSLNMRMVLILILLFLIASLTFLIVVTYRRMNGEPAMPILSSAQQRPTIPPKPVEPLNCGTRALAQADYRGTMRITQNGRVCQRWDSQFPHKHTRISEKYPNSGLEENYCRNPDGKLPCVVGILSFFLLPSSLTKTSSNFFVFCMSCRRDTCLVLH